MAKCNLSAKELTVDTFSPRIAVLCSPAAQAICDKNNLKFTQLIQPFTSFTTALSWKEPTGGQIFPKLLKITPVDLASWKPPDSDTQKNRNIQYSVVSQCLPPTVQLVKAFSSKSRTPKNSMSQGSPENTEANLQQLVLKQQKLGKKEAGISLTDYEVTIPPSTPWFEQWRETFLKHFVEQQSNQYEFLSQFIACILVISSAEGKTSDELGTIVGKLSKLQLQHQTEWPQTWFLPSMLKYYVILHDNGGTQSLSEAEANYQQLRSMYGGGFCYMLKINSGNKEEQSVQDPWTFYINQEQHYSEPSPDVVEASEQSVDVFNFGQILHPLSPESELASKMFLPNGGETGRSRRDSTKSHSKSILRGQFMTQEDLQNIQNTVNEFWGKSLLPHIERQCRLLHESIVNRRSMSKSFFGATKRLFGTSKTPGAVVYPLDSSEMMTRKLADLYFLFGHYAGAYQLYHQLKKDFQGDQAWPYYASSLEMAAISHFMMTQSDTSLTARAFPAHYIQEAIRCYFENCRMTDAAIRCAVICCECLKQLDNYAEAATVLIRMTSGDCDVRSALMLEQAAYAFIQLNSPRKYALHSVLAGNRFNKAGLKYHSLNSYLQAGKVFFGRGWRFAEDHIHFTIGKHQSLLSLHTHMAEHFKSLLRFPTPPVPAQVEVYYKEFLLIASKLYEEDKLIQDFFIPKILGSEIKVRIGNTGVVVGEIPAPSQLSSDLPVQSTDSIEEQVVKECIDNTVIFFKPCRLLFDSATDNTVHPTVPCDESFHVEIPFHNPLLVPLTIQRIHLCFDSSAVSATLVNELSLTPGETKFIRFEVLGSNPEKVSFDWINYELRLGSLVVPFKQKLHLKGPRLNSSKAERGSKVYAKDFRNKFNLIEQMPLLQAELEGLPPALFQSQSTNFNLVLHDKSKSLEQRRRISKIILASENMSEFLEVSKEMPLHKIDSVEKNYCPISVNLDGSPTVKIPCIFKAPQMQLAQLNILILYQVSELPTSNTQLETDEVLPFSTKLRALPYRVVKVCMSIPLIPSLKLDYFFLKAVSSVQFLGLLKVENMIQQMGQMEISKLEFFPSSKYAIEGQIAVGSPKQNLRVGSLESRNIIMKIQESSSQKRLTEQESTEADKSDDHLFVRLSWSFSLTSSDMNRTNNNNKPTASGVYKLPIGTDSLRKPLSIGPAPNPEGDKFHFVIKHLSQAAHDFNRLSCFVFPVTLELYSCWSGKINLQIECSKTSDETDQTAEPDSRFSNSSELILIGQTRWTLDAREYECQKFCYSVGISRPGVFNVAPNITVTRFLENGAFSEPEHISSLHSPIIVAHQRTLI